MKPTTSRQRKFLFAALAMGLVAVAAAAVQEMFSVYKFGGIDTETNPLFLSDSNTPDSQNVVTDTGPGLGARAGFVSFSTETASAQAWNFSPSNGTKYHIIRVAGTIKATTGNGTYNLTVSTVSSSVTTAAAQLGDRFYFMNTTDGLKYWDMSTVTTASATLTGSILVAYKGRLLASGLTATPRTIYISKFSDGATWTNASEATTESDNVQVGGGLDEKINGIFSSFNGVAVWFRNSSFGSLDGSRRGGFSLRTFSDVVGTAYPDTARDCDGILRFLGPRKAVYEWDGAVLRRISDPIRTLLGTVAQGDANSRSYVATLKADFDAGTNYQTSNAIISGDVMLTTWTVTDTTTADFTAGTASNTSIINNRVYLSTNNTNMDNPSFESGSSNDADNWTEGGSPETANRDQYAFAYDVLGDTPFCNGGGFCMALANTSTTRLDWTSGNKAYTVYLLDTSGNVLTSSAYTAIAFGASTTGFIQKTFTSSTYAGAWVKVKFLDPDNGAFIQSSSPFLFSGQFTWYDKWSPYHWNAGTTYGAVVIDTTAGGKSTIYSGTFTSQAFNTGLSSAAWSASGANWTTNSNAISAQTQSSSDGVTWQTAVAWSTGSAPSSDFRKYIRYVVTLSTGGTTNGTSLPYVDDVTLIARANSGKWVSQAISLGSISGFGIFTEDTSLDSGTVTYAIYTDTDTNMTITNGVPVAGTYTSSAVVTNNNVPSVSTAAYCRLSSSYSISSGANNPTTHSVSIQWAEGSLLAVPGTWYNQRYWLPVALNSTTNNRVLVYDRKNEWQLYSGVNCVWTGVYNGSLLFGNTSGIFTGDSGTTDNGSAISAYYKTKDFPLNGIDKKFFFDWDILTAVEKAGTLSTQYFVNGRTSGTSLGDMNMAADSGLNVLRLNVPSDSATQLMRTVALKFSVTASTAWKLLMSNLYYQRDPEVE